MIRSKCCFFVVGSTIFAIFSLTHREEEVWLDGTHPMLFAESNCVCMPKFKPVDLFFFFFFFLSTVSFFVSSLYRKGRHLIDMLMTFPW